MQGDNMRTGQYHPCDRNAAFTPQKCGSARNQLRTLWGGTQRALFDNAQSNGPEEAGHQQLRVFGPVLPCGKGQASSGAGSAVEQPLGPLRQRKARTAPVRAPLAVVGKLFVADEPVGPEVDDSYFQLVLPGVHAAGDISLERRFPERTKIMAIDF